MRVNRSLILYGASMAAGAVAVFAFMEAENELQEESERRAEDYEAEVSRRAEDMIRKREMETEQARREETS